MRYPSLGTITKSAILCLTIILIFFLISIKNEKRRQNFLLQLANDRVQDNSVYFQHIRKRAKGRFQKNAPVKRPVIQSRSKPEKLIPTYFSKPLETGGINCNALSKGNMATLTKAKRLNQETKMAAISNSKYQEMTKHCPTFKRTRQYITDPLTEEERTFPLAYSIVMFQSVYQTELLLRAIYRPQNFYCIHVDKKAPSAMQQTLTSIARCFKNVFVISFPVEVTRGTLSVINADLKCLRFLSKYTNWKYFINLSGQHFPLKTNYEIVRVLKALKGSNDVKGLPVRNNGKNATKLPNGLFLYTGSVSVILSRATTKHITSHPAPRRLLAWSRAKPNSHLNFFATINYNPQNNVKGTYKGPLKAGILKNMPHIKNYINDQSGTNRLPCHGIRVRNVCVFGIGDLPYLMKRKELFAYKFKWDFQHTALQCLVYMIHERSRRQYMNPQKFDDLYYKTLPFVKYRV